MKLVMLNIPKERGKEIIEEYYGKSFSWKESENSISTYLHSTKIEITDDEE
ncbi:hypothetical protein LCGC14_2110520 [marine sediment metagenome]|uniref:Uncharacterized protein n=1 Tax=marine sediment metagenome TaxID=412755 RepID=A0A0F9E7B9_9ZZZZ